MPPQTRLCESCQTPILQASLLPDSNGLAKVREILRSGDSAPLEAPRFHDVISSSTVELGSYDDHIDALETLLRKRKAERSAVKQYVQACRAVFSPIRRLPPEILCEIFTMCGRGHWHARSATVGDELYTLKRVHLLRLSRVCVQWNRLVMHTPGLWSRINVTLNHWSRPSYLSLLNDLLALSIQRSVSSPLHVRAGVDGSPSLLPVQPALEFLAHHSERWHTAVFNIGAPIFDCMSHIQGKLPQLRSLRIRTWPQGSKSLQVDLFEDAPRLVDVAFTGPISLLPKLPWDTLHRFAYISGVPEDLSAALSLMRLCAPSSVFQISRLDVSRQSLPLNLPSITSSISTLDLDLTVQSNAEHARDVLGEIMGSFTLPYARSLRFNADSRAPLHWPTSSFLSLLSRSGFHITLHTLELNAVIPADELFQCLSVLPALSVLSLSDYPAPGVDHVLLTDDVFRRLAWIPDADADAAAPVCLVPKLSHLRCMARLRFSDDVFLDFVRSRSRSFKVDLRWFPEREMGGAACAQLEELRRRGELIFSSTRQGKF
ncbi:hypothetical protein B0H11DRAFT_1996866 [Mycena galericulata]|nr:hypothetical protein B0H11DRAFT_1996866 [Mycena galericulata]